MVFPHLNHGFLANDQLVFSRRVLKVDVLNLPPLVCCGSWGCFSLLLADGALLFTLPLPRATLRCLLGAPSVNPVRI